MNKKSYKKLIKIIAMALCVCFTVMLLFSFVYIIKEINHNCIGEHCQTCENIRIMENCCQEILSLIITVHILIALLNQIITKKYLYLVTFFSYSPIQLKVKLNN